MIYVVWFQSTKLAKLTAVIMGVLALSQLVWGLIVWGGDFYKQSFHDEIHATVTERHLFIFGDRHEAWTDVVYEYHGEIHTLRFDWYIPWAREGSEVRLLINPNNPEQITLITPAFGSFPLPQIISAGLFSAFFTLYLFNFLLNRKRDRSQEKDGQIATHTETSGSKKKPIQNFIIVLVIFGIVGVIFGIVRALPTIQVDQDARERHEQWREQHQEGLAVLLEQFPLGEAGFPIGFTNSIDGSQIYFGMHRDDIRLARVSTEIENAFLAENSIPENTGLYGFGRVDMMIFYNEENIATGFLTTSTLWMVAGGISVGDATEKISEVFDNLQYDTERSTIYILDNLDNPLYSLEFGYSERGQITQIRLLRYYDY